MLLLLQQLPPVAGPDGDGYNGKFPTRALFMHPQAAAALLALEKATGGLVYTDIYRSPEAILQAYRMRPGTQPVAFSYHGFGGCVDLDVYPSLKRLGITYDGLLATMTAHGFHCHRRDGKQGSESWHFNYLGDHPEVPLALTTADHSTWARPAETMIQRWYGGALKPSDTDVDAMLRTAGVSDVRTFQRKWNLVVDGVAGPTTRRVLAFVTAVVQITPTPLLVA
jgi:peptidoglycan hydrolase-like protein with peptidoglycan-binding domain